MKNENKKGFINIQLFGEDSNDATTSKTTGTETQIDYESEYKKILAERDSYKAEAEKQKGLKDKYASENADYKKKELDKMTDDEKKAKELQDLIDSKNKMEAEIKQMKLEKDLLSNGFTAEESSKLINSNFSVKDIAEIIKEKVDLAVKSAKAEMIKGTTPSAQMGIGTATDKGESGYQKYQKSKQTTNNKVEL